MISWVQCKRTVLSPSSTRSLFFSFQPITTSHAHLEPITCKLSGFQTCCGQPPSLHPLKPSNRKPPEKFRLPAPFLITTTRAVAPGWGGSLLYTQIYSSTSHGFILPIKPFGLNMVLQCLTCGPDLANRSGTPHWDVDHICAKTILLCGLHGSVSIRIVCIIVASSINAQALQQPPDNVSHQIQSHSPLCHRRTPAEPAPVVLKWPCPPACLGGRFTQEHEMTAVESVIFAKCNLLHPEQRPLVCEQSKKKKKNFNHV